MAFDDHGSWVFMLATSLVWGLTNPLLKRGAEVAHEQQKQRGHHAQGSFRRHLTSLLLNWQYILPQLVNWSGSVFFVMALQYSALSTAVPIVNAMTFVFTEICARFVLRQDSSVNRSMSESLRVYGGITCILIGITITMTS